MSQVKIQPLSVALRAFHDLVLSYLSRLIHHHFPPHTLCFNKTELLIVSKIHQGALTILCIHPGCYLSTTPPVNQSFLLLLIHLSITKNIHSTNIYWAPLPETVLNIGNPAVNYGLSPYPDGICNPIKTKDTKQLIISVVRIIKAVGNTVHNGTYIRW